MDESSMCVGYGPTRSDCGAVVDKGWWVNGRRVWQVGLIGMWGSGTRVEDQGCADGGLAGQAVQLQYKQIWEKRHMIWITTYREWKEELNLCTHTQTNTHRLTQTPFAFFELLDISWWWLILFNLQHGRRHLHRHPLPHLRIHNMFLNITSSTLLNDVCQHTLMSLFDAPVKWLQSFNCKLTISVRCIISVSVNERLHVYMIPSGLNKGSK